MQFKWPGEVDSKVKIFRYRWPFRTQGFPFLYKTKKILEKIQNTNSKKKINICLDIKPIVDHFKEKILQKTWTYNLRGMTIGKEGPTQAKWRRRSWGKGEGVAT